MTNRERAKEATWEAGGPDWGSDDQERLEMAVEQAITAAVEEEREECAKMVESLSIGLADYSPDVQDDIVRRIRERCNKSAEGRNDA